MSELFPGCFSCSNNFIFSQSSSGLDGKIIKFEIPEAETIKPGDLSNLMRVLSRVVFLLIPFTSICLSFAKSYNIFLSVKLARLIL